MRAASGETGGIFVDAQDPAMLLSGIEQAFEPREFVVSDDGGAAIASGTVDGDPVSVPAGRYRVRVRSASQPIEFTGIEVKRDQPTTIELAR
jgi:hypothetical protein